MDDFVSVVARLQGREAPGAGQPDRAVTSKLLQLMHFQLIEAHQRIRYLEERQQPDARRTGAPHQPGGLPSALRRLLSKR